MAKEKILGALTQEEHLERALVPDWEWPYKVPENWVWTLGKSIFLPLETRKPFGDLFRYIDIDSIDNKNQIVNNPKILAISKAPSRASRKISNGDTVFSMVRPYLKNIAYIDESLSDCIASTGFFVCHPTKPLNNRFIYWLMTSEYVVEGLNQYMKGDNSPSIRQSDIENFVYPIPPFAEQQRIVDRIESLFVKLDEAQEKAQAALDSFESRKAAILHKAFNGELTPKWREEHGIRRENWKDTNIGKLAVLITKGASPKWQGIEYTDDRAQTLFVTSENVREGYLDFSKEKYLDNRINEIQKRSVLQYGDVLLNIVGASIGRAAIFNLHQLANTNQAVCIVRLNLNVNREFICYYFNSPVALQYYSLNKVDVARANISLGDVKDMVIKLPYIREQQEIVCILDDLFAKEKQAKDVCAEMLAQIDLIKKSILARAFRGELGTNDPTEESAVELLKHFLTQQANEQAQTSKKKRAPTIVLSEEVRSRLSSKLERDIYLLLQKNGPSNMREIASISKKDLDVIEVLRQLEKKGLIQKQSDGAYGCVR